MKAFLSAPLALVALAGQAYAAVNVFSKGIPGLLAQDKQR